MASEINKAKLTETDIITKFILPAVKNEGWDDMTQIRQEVKLRDGKVIVRGQMAARQTVKSADIVLYHKPSMPLAVIEANSPQGYQTKNSEVCLHLKGGNKNIWGWLIAQKRKKSL